MAKVSYASAVGCLMYAMVCTCPDLAHAVSQVCKYVSKPSRHHREAIKWIFRYLKGTVGYGVIFGSQQNDPLVVGFVDSDYAGDLDIEEYMAVAEAAKEALWINGLAKELGVEQGGVQLHCDGQSVIYLAKNQVYHARTKYIDVRYYKSRELIASGEIILQKVHTSENAADMLTKPLTVDKCNHCLDLLNVYSC
ncbi:UNVERIFIED_CONTAM: Retrovirus-related Pol polyprotein from transposon TNT 1-94 [Sesamum radiatum]|uniref:Retrovirus-related Pol polyprotein from transposon TNT 1-94 n=1 Tax=Sesamum radiatum TaxID=300843 RepID=A0AAW2TI66_SESRA